MIGHVLTLEPERDGTVVLKTECVQGRIISVLMDVVALEDDALLIGRYLEDTAQFQLEIVDHQRLLAMHENVFAF